jgi:hypothetical protein
MSQMMNLQKIFRKEWTKSKLIRKKRTVKNAAMKKKKTFRKLKHAAIQKNLTKDLMETSK